MHDIAWKPGVPRAILLATDLDGRCDRALDRAVALAREWQAKLIVLTVVEPPAAPPPRRGDVPTHASQAALRAAARLRRDVGPVADVDYELLVREGRIGDCIEAVARETGCSLIVTGVAHDAFFGRRLLGSTVVKDRVTELLDVEAAVRSVDPDFYDDLVSYSDDHSGDAVSAANYAGVY